MSTMNRRELLQSLLASALQTGGAVVLACAALPAAAAQANQEPLAEGDLQKRADRVADEGDDDPRNHGFAPSLFRRGGFANGGYGGGFRRGGFANGGYGGGFRRGGFANGGWYG
jgi:rSAM-associated Gly-rich repeat protein